MNELLEEEFDAAQQAGILMISSMHSCLYSRRRSPARADITVTIGSAVPDNRTVCVERSHLTWARGIEGKRRMSKRCSAISRYSKAFSYEVCRSTALRSQWTFSVFCSILPGTLCGLQPEVTRSPALPGDAGDDGEMTHFRYGICRRSRRAKVHFDMALSGHSSRAAKVSRGVSRLESVP